MEESLINKKIKEVMDEYPFEKPPLIGVYGVDNENITVAYLYEKDEGKLGTNMNDMTYHGFKPVKHVYNILAKGYKPFYISDVAHQNCWKETIREMDDQDSYTEPYHHGRRLYFEYCKTHEIDARYMSQFDKGNIASAADVFTAYDEKLRGIVKKKLEAYSSINPTTLKNFEYLLNEPFYNDLELGYTLEDKHGTISFFPYDSSSSVALIRDSEYPFVRDLQDWGFDFETDLFNELQSGATIRFMSLDTHENVIAELEMVSKTDYDPKTQEGIQKYLKYCKRNNIHSYLPDKDRSQLKELFKNYDLAKTEHNHER